jgi:hypothetical protein
LLFLAITAQFAFSTTAGITVIAQISRGLAGAIKLAFKKLNSNFDEQNIVLVHHIDGRRTIERVQAMRRYCDNEASLALLIINPSPSCEAAKSTMLLLPHLRGRFRWLAVRRRVPVTHLH